MSNNKVKELCVVYDKLVRLTGTALNNINYTSLNSIEKKTFYEFLERINISTFVISTLFSHYFANDKMKFPIASHLRILLIDCITIYYLIGNNDKPDSFLTKINRLSKPVFKEQKELYESMAKNGSEDYKDYIVLVKTVFSEMYDSKGKVKYSFCDLSVKEMYEALVKKKPNIVFDNMYKLFQYFSNYVHYSKITKKILDAPVDQDFNRFIISTGHITDTIYEVFVQLGVELDNQQFEELKKMLLKI